MLDEKKRIAVIEALGKPVMLDMSVETLRIRLNLLMLSALTIGSRVFDVRLGEKTSFFGVEVQNLTETKIATALLIFNIYCFVHFLWCCIDAYDAWRIRLTGTRTAFVTTGMFAAEDGDYPNDPQQSSLMNWWKAQGQRLSSTNDAIKEIREICSTTSSVLQTLKQPPTPDAQGASQMLSQLNSAIERAQNHIANAASIIESARIPVSLERFERYYYFLLTSQNIRWILIDAFLPLALATIAICLLVVDLRWVA